MVAEQLSPYIDRHLRHDIGNIAQNGGKVCPPYGACENSAFMRECQAYTSKRAKESHIKNGTYPAKGYYSPNLQKGAQYQFQTGVKHPITQK